jgi:hypothetical protein
MAFVAIKIGCRTAAAPFSSQSSGPWSVGRFFCVARSLRINSDMLVARALKNSLLIRQRPDESYVSLPPETPSVSIFFNWQVNQ